MALSTNGHLIGKGCGACCHHKAFFAATHVETATGAWACLGTEAGQAGALGCLRVNILNNTFDLHCKYLKCVEHPATLTEIVDIL